MAEVESNMDMGAQGAVEATRDASGTSVVELIGEIDISNADALGASLERLVESGTSHLVVDLTRLEFMDSSGIAMLLRAAGRVDSVEIRNPSNVIRRIIECTGLADVLRIES